METKNYKFRKGWGFKVDPNIAGEIIEHLANKNGEITPQIVLQEAKSKKSPLHDCFDWDNKIASENWRLHQARRLIGAITVEIMLNEPTEVKAFVNITMPEAEQCYYSMSTISRDEEKLQLIMADAKRQLVLWSNKHRIYKALLEACQTIDQLVEKM